MLGLAVLLITQEHRLMGDGLARYQALIDLLGHQRMPDTAYSMIGPLFAAPLWILSQYTGNTEGLLGNYNPLLFCLMLGAFYLMLRRHVDAGLLRRFLLILTTGSMIAPHLADFYGETFTMSTVGVGLLALALRRPPKGIRAGAWALIVLGVANTPASIVGLAFVACLESVRRRRIGPMVSLFAAVALIVGESWLRRGGPFVTGYTDNHGAETIMPYSGHSGFSYPFTLGLLAIVFSFGKGLLWFTPGLFLPVRRRLSAASKTGSAIDLGYAWLLWTTFTVGLVVIYARWWAWYGGMYWGPRFFLIAILPAALGLAVWLGDPRASPIRTVITLGLLAVSVWVASNGLAFGDLWAWTCYQDGYRLEALCHFTPEFSPLWYPLVARPDLSPSQQLQLMLHAAVLLWLAAPLVTRLAQYARALTRSLSARLDLKTWRW
ncbi:hypothetical protein ACFFMR_02650 [Micromonospora andamanensis]|uniref:DUF2029 domain-containing protein n=1 Tax=Micromonospora andamanensis TaxID=1287068 RepID=A0ABQ4I3L7_9ACTN|nr:hypothetical protein [Micromonospora andamanensis]GIJ12505.1 hypothetical protein Van01_57190 [Micromonospora andamanensis]